MQDKIPVHYGDGFEVDRWGSKYEVLIYGLIPLVFGGIMNALYRADSNDSKKNVRLYGGIVGLSVFNVIIYGFIYNAFRLTNSSTKLVAINLSQIILVTLGIGLIVTGSIISKTKNNKLTGISITKKIRMKKMGYTAAYSWCVSDGLGNRNCYY